MRLQKYINEAVIKPNSKDISALKSTFVKNAKAFLKRTKNDGDESKVFSTLVSWANDFSKKIRDIDFEIKVWKGGDPQGSARAGLPKHNMKLYYKPHVANGYFYNDRTPNERAKLESIMQWFYYEALVTLEHELVHIEQYRRISQGRDINQMAKILNGLHDKQDRIHDKTGNRMDGYLNDVLETMAHAKAAASDIADIYDDPEMAIDMLKNDEGQDEIAMDSDAFDMYYANIKDKYPKTWNKFMKYLVQYLQKEKKK